MAVLGASFRLYVDVNAVPQLLFDIRTGAADRPTLRDITLTMPLNVANLTAVWAMGRNATVGAKLPNDIAFLPEDGQSPVGNLAIGVDWSTMPTVPANYFRRLTNRPATGTNGVQIVFPFSELILEPSTSFGFWILAGALLMSQTDVHVGVNVDL